MLLLLTDSAVEASRGLHLVQHMVSVSVSKRWWIYREMLNHILSLLKQLQQTYSLEQSLPNEVCQYCAFPNNKVTDLLCWTFPPCFSSPSRSWCRSWMPGSQRGAGKQKNICHSKLYCCQFMISKPWCWWFLYFIIKKCKEKGIKTRISSDILLYLVFK